MCVPGCASILDFGRRPQICAHVFLLKPRLKLKLELKPRLKLKLLLWLLLCVTILLWSCYLCLCRLSDAFGPFLFVRLSLVYFICLFVSLLFALSPPFHSPPPWLGQEHSLAAWLEMLLTSFELCHLFRAIRCLRLLL